MIFEIKIDLPILHVDIIGIYFQKMGLMVHFKKNLECYVIMYAKKEFLVDF